jgi:hypothetical protein
MNNKTFIHNSMRFVTAIPSILTWLRTSDGIENNLPRAGSATYSGANVEVIAGYIEEARRIFVAEHALDILEKAAELVTKDRDDILQALEPRPPGY